MDSVKKEKLYLHILSMLDQKVVELSNAILSAKDSRDADTKSSAGDKHETSRAQAQIEIDKLETQLNKTQILQKEFTGINLQKKYEQVELGSLVLTNQENYFISIGLGKIELEAQIYYTVSLASPIGMALKNKRVGEVILFQGREIIIQQIY